MTAAVVDRPTPGIMSAAAALVAAPPAPAGSGRTPTAIRDAIRVLQKRPHIVAEPRPPVAACRGCRNKPLVNPDPDPERPLTFAEGLSMALLWNV